MQSSPIVIPPRNMTVQPDRVRVRLVFTKSGSLSAVGFYTSVRLSPTNVYDIDPLIGSSATPGFTEWSAFYRFYRTVKSTITCDFATSEVTPVLAALVLTNFDQGAAWDFRPYLGNNRSRYALMGGAAGNSKTRLSVAASTASFAGVSNVMIQDPYSAVVTGSPTNNWWVNIGVSSPSNVAMANGTSFFIRLEITVDFFERTVLSA